MSNAAELTGKLFDAFEKRDIAAASAMISPDAVWRFPGQSGALAGDHRGHEEIFAFLFKVMALTDGTFKAERINLIGDAKVAFLHFIGRAERNGKTLDNPTVLRLEFSTDKLIEAREWVWDLDHVEEFWN